MTADELAAIKARRETAQTELHRIIDVKYSGSPCTAFKMSLPAQLTDSDVVIGSALADIDALIVEVERLQAARDEIHDAVTGQIDSADEEVMDYKKRGKFTASPEYWKGYRHALEYIREYMALQKREQEQSR